MRTGTIPAALLAAAVGLLAGCGGGPAAATVSGVVKVDGVPLAKGTISFAPADDTGQPASATVENGRYEVRTTVGKKTVQISAPVVTDKRKDSAAPDAFWVEITAESLPDRYHAKSELAFEVQPGANTKDWELAVKKK